MTPHRRVALDARRIHGNRRGVGQYVCQLAKWLPLVDDSIDFVLFVDHPIPEGLVPEGCSVAVVGGREDHARSQSKSGVGDKLWSLYWMNLLLPPILRRERIDLFHATNFAMPLLGKFPTVVTVHDLIYARAPGAFEKSYEMYLGLVVPAAAKRARHVIVDSESTRRDLVDLVDISPDRATAIHLAMGEEYSPLQEETYLEEVRQKLELPDRYVLHVGAIERRKKLDVLLHACARLFRTGLLDRVVLAGEEGYGAEAVWNTARNLGIMERVQHLGYVDTDLLPGLYRLAMVLSLASVYEGFGMPVLEAMACGTPAVVSNVSSLPEIAGDAALAVPPGDVPSLSDALERLLTDNELRRAMVARGLRRTESFSWERTARDHVAVYRRVLDGQSS